jgi:hypothetical protein
MRIHDLVQRYDGMIGIVVRTHKTRIVQIMMFPSGVLSDQLKHDWKVINEGR